MDDAVTEHNALNAVNRNTLSRTAAQNALLAREPCSGKRRCDARVMRGAGVTAGAVGSVYGLPVEAQTKGSFLIPYLEHNG